MANGIVVSCACGEVYELKPEYAGRLLACAACGRHLHAGPAPGAPPAPTPGGDPAFDRDVFLLRQRALSIASKYEVWDEHGRPILFVERPTYPVRSLLAYVAAGLAATLALDWTVRLAQAAGEAGALVAAVALLGVMPAVFLVVSMSLRPRRHVTIYRDESRREVILRVAQDQRVALVTRTYTLLAATGEPLARFRKTYVHNVLRKRWAVEVPPGVTVATALEDSAVLSLLRRVLGPFFGILRANFVIVRDEHEVIGEFNRKLTVLDRYVLDLRLDAGRTLDRRVALALGVMLDTGERR